jgi:hypothetical protein
MKTERAAIRSMPALSFVHGEPTIWNDSHTDGRRGLICVNFRFGQPAYSRRTNTKLPQASLVHCRALPVNYSNFRNF